MRLLPLPDGALRLRLDLDEAHLLDQLVGQLIELLRSHSGTALDPDPLFASLEVGGSEVPPDDPALARLFPDAYEGGDEASEFRRVTEQGLLNRKLQDALDVSGALGVGALPDVGEAPEAIEIEVSEAALPAWVRSLTSLRLAIAARLGLEHEEDHARLAGDEETRGTLLVYDWLAAIIDSLLRAGQGDDPPAHQPDEA
jgi:hypothetical protein